MTQFLDYLSAERNRSANTIESYRHDLLGFAALIRRDVRKATREDIRRYLSRSLADGLSPVTVRRRLEALRSLFDFLLAEDLIATNPCRGVHSPKGSGSIIRPISNGEIDRVVAAFVGESRMELRDKAIVLTLYGSALRGSELIGLRLEDVDFPQQQIFVRQGKGAQDRLALMNERQSAALLTYIDTARPKYVRGTDPGWLFLDRNGTAMSRVNLYHILKKASRAALGRTVSSHKFRHACCTEVIRNGMDVRVAQEMMGHKSVETTMRYVHTDFEYLRVNYLKLHPRGEYAETAMPDRPHRSVFRRSGRGEQQPLHVESLPSRPQRVCRVYRCGADDRANHAHNR
ncbi:MAG: tyrosine-type recombinase/integrase [Terriglobales bacterium]